MPPTKLDREKELATMLAALLADTPELRKQFRKHGSVAGIMQKRTRNYFGKGEYDLHEMANGWIHFSFSLTVKRE